MELTFGEKIKEARKSQNLTQKQLAEKIGAKHNSISDWENNKNKPDPDTIELLCGVLKITPNFLLTTSDDAFSPKENIIIKKYRSLDDSGKEHIEYELEREYIRARQSKEQKEYIIELENLAQEEHQRNTETRLINYYYRLASAGTGQIIFDTPPTKRIEIPDIPKYRNVDYAIGVNGTSMEPTYKDNDTLLVEMADEVDKGEIGIFSVDNNCYVKKRGDKELISLNPDSPNIPLNESARCMGRVLDKLDYTE